MDPLSRRRFMTTGGATVGAVAVGGAVGFGIGHNTARATPSPGSPPPPAGVGVEPFYGRHQSGIVTAQQDRLMFAAFDVTTTARDDLVALLRTWTDASARIVAGLEVGDPAAHRLAPPTDTGEAVGLDPAHLTITFGFGPSLFTSAGVDRFGLAAARPASLTDLPAFVGDELDPAFVGGDLCVQACSNDPLVAYHAIRNLTRIGRGSVALRWTQEGFGRTSSTTSEQFTPRNLMGFKDGTDNLRGGNAEFDENVWATSADGPPWMTDGTYLVARRIRINVEVWDRSSLEDQENTFGRTKIEGAPLGATLERDAIDLDAKHPDGTLVIAENAHVRLANQARLGIHLLRRGYSFTDGIDARTGQLDAGLFFLAYQRDPRTQFIPMQDGLAGVDALNEYIKHVGSAIFAVPPGVTGPGGFVGEALFT